MGSLEVKLGDVVQLADDEEDSEGDAKMAEGEARPEPALGLVLCLFEDSDGDKMVQVGAKLRGYSMELGGRMGASGTLWVSSALS